MYLLGLVYEPKSEGRSMKYKSMDPGDRIKTHDSQSDGVMQQLQLQAQEAGGNSLETEALEGDDLIEQRLHASFGRKDLDGSGFLHKRELSTDLASSGCVDFKDFVDFAEQSQNELSKPEKKSCTLINIGWIKAGVNNRPLRHGDLTHTRKSAFQIYETSAKLLDRLIDWRRSHRSAYV